MLEGAGANFCLEFLNLIDPDASRSVLALASAGTMAEFSAQPISPAEASQTAEALAALKRALISCAPALQKARFVLDPRVTLGRH